MSDLETLVLRRQSPSIQGTFGQIFREGKQLCVTCEPANPFPSGKYICIPHDGPEFKNVWEIANIPGHTAILIHNGNTITDTKGCVLVGDTYGVVNVYRAVMNSVKTLNMLRSLLPEQFYLDVIDYNQEGELP